MLGTAALISHANCGRPFLVDVRASAGVRVKLVKTQPGAPRPRPGALRTKEAWSVAWA